jgi:hypothetical protein
MTKDERFWRRLERKLCSDDGRAAKEHLAAGRPIYYCDDRFENEIVREWPDGSKELLTLDNDGAVIYRRAWHANKI